MAVKRRNGHSEIHPWDLTHHRLSAEERALHWDVLNYDSVHVGGLECNLLVKMSLECTLYFSSK